MHTLIHKDIYIYTVAVSNVDISIYVVIHHVVSIAKDERRSLIPGFVFLFL